MGLRIVCSGYLVRYPLGGFSWHHLQYLVGLTRMGHEVTYVEDYGGEDSCYDPSSDTMTADPTYGLAFLEALLEPHGLSRWCYLAQDGSARGMAREEMAQSLRDADLYVNLSNMNAIPEANACRRRALVDTDPVLTQLGAHGVGPPFTEYHALFTYGENIHSRGSRMPDAGHAWIPTRQPVVLDLWPTTEGDPDSPFSTVTSWRPVKRDLPGGFGQKDREFRRYMSFPRDTGYPMEVALAAAPERVHERLRRGGWSIRDPLQVARRPVDFQRYIGGSRAEFSVAKHAHVATRCGWFSERSTGYLASGRPVLVQNTGFDEVLPTGEGLLSFSGPEEALRGLDLITEDYEAQCRAARKVVEEYFDASAVLSDLLEASL